MEVVHIVSIHVEQRGEVHECGDILRMRCMCNEFE